MMRCGVCSAIGARRHSIILCTVLVVLPAEYGRGSQALSSPVGSTAGLAQLARHHRA